MSRPHSVHESPLPDDRPGEKRTLTRRDEKKTLLGGGEEEVQKAALHGGADLRAYQVQSGIQKLSLKIPGEGSGGIPIDVHWLQSAEDPPPSKGHGGGIREKAGGICTLRGHPTLLVESILPPVS